MSLWNSSSAFTLSSLPFSVSLISYTEQYMEYDPFVTAPEPSNPWTNDDPAFWDLEARYRTRDYGGFTVTLCEHFKSIFVNNLTGSSHTGFFFLMFSRDITLWLLNQFQVHAEPWKCFKACWEGFALLGTEIALEFHFTHQKYAFAGWICSNI